LAKIIMSQRADDLEYITSKYINNTVENEDEALEGARHIIAEWISERTDIRNLIRRELERFSSITTKVVKTKKDDDKAQKFNDRVLDKIDRKIINSNNECGDQIETAISDAYERLLLPSLTTEAIKNAKEKADNSAIEVFTKNLEQLLLSAPLGEKRILAIDPGFRTGCKVVCLNEQGDLLANTTIYPNAPQNKISEASYEVEHLIKNHNIEAISIGNGTASRETERFVKNIAITKNLQVFVVNEAGASIYSASKIARDEFPDKDVTVRGAVSIGRRLADPLAELVKIEPKSIGVGQYQHDVDQTKLKKSLDTVVESCVNKVGVNINTAQRIL